MKRDLARIIAVGGALVVMASVLWEYARMQPDNNYFVEPWSIRGLETVHGVVVFAIGASLLLGALAVASKVTQAPRNSVAGAGGMVFAGFIITLIFAGDEEITFAGGSVVTAVFGLALGFTVYLGLLRLADRGSFGDSERIKGAFKGRTGIAILFITEVVLYVITGALAGSERTLSAPVGVLLLMLVIGAMMSLMSPTAMAANRMLMASAVVAGTAIGFTAGAVRSTLIRFQADTGPFFIPGEYRDTQVTWGYFIANIGVVLVFAGAVMLWARRRDVVQSEQRAAKQRAAAEESAKELATAG